MEGTVWNMTADVVVIGYGGAGATAAIAAHDVGAEVVVLESTAQGGGNTLVSFGGFMHPEDPAEALRYLTGLYDYSRSVRDDRLLHAFVEEAAKTMDWLKGLHPDVAFQTYGGASYPQLAGSGAIRRYVVKGPNKGTTAFAQNLWQLLSHAVEHERKIPVLTLAPAKRLATDSQGEVTGVIAGSGRQEISIRARRGVILATGGYEFDRATLLNSVKGDPIHALGHPGNRGDGVRMAQKVGAGLWHMNGVSCAFGIKVPEFESALLIAVGAAGQILVDRSGRRFVNEGAIERHAALLTVDFFDSQSLNYPRIPCYLLFDEAARKRGPVSRTAGLGASGVRHAWSRDNSMEIEKGWIKRDETLAGLARKLGMETAVLQHTVDKWNTGVRTGRDTLYGRDLPDDLLTALIETGPFHAMEIHPCLINTQGGPRRNESARIMDPFDEPIPHLYSAGELGSMWGLIYQGGGNIAECLAVGRIAGRNAGRAPDTDGQAPSGR